MFKVNNEKIRLICWICSKLKLNTIWHRSSVFNVDFDQSQYISIMFLLLTLNKNLSVGCERQVIMFWKHEKRHIRLVIEVARPISFSDLSLHRIEINYEQMTIRWTYYRAVGSLFKVEGEGGGEEGRGGWVKMSATMVGRRQKKQKQKQKQKKTLAQMP